MRTEDEEISAARTGAPLSGLRRDDVNTPRWLRGRPLAVWNGKLHAQRVLLVLCGAALTLLVAVQVFTRYVMGISIFGIEELASFVAVYLYFIGASHGAWERGHISASLVDLVLPGGWAQRAAHTVASLVTVVLSAWMSVWAWQFLAYTIQRETMSLETGIPMSFVHGVIPVSLTMCTVYFLIELMDHLRRLPAGPAAVRGAR